MGLFTPLPMRRVSLFLLREELPAAALALGECGVFDPQQQEYQHSEHGGRPGHDYQQLYRSARVRLDKILAHTEIAPDFTNEELVPRVVSEVELRELNEWLGMVWRECSQCEENQRDLQERERTVEQLRHTLKNFAMLDIDLGQLQGERVFLDIHIGNLPEASLKRLTDAVSLIGYTVTVYLRSEQTAHVVLAGLKGAEEELASVLEAASFRRMALPEEFSATPMEVQRQLRERERSNQARRQELAIEMSKRRERYAEGLRKAEVTLRLAAPHAELVEAVSGRGALVVLTGWVPEDRMAQLRASLGERLSGGFALEDRAPTLEECAQVPSLQRFPAILRPFADLVRNYGIPRYTEVDPTWLFAVTFILMFGMMFGDVGHGATFALLAWWQRKRLKQYTPFALLAGGTSIVFGLLYGSLFGNEHILTPLWMSPLSDPILMLTLALVWGVGFILLATGLTIRNRLVDGRYAEALATGDGLAGLVFYLLLLFTLYRLAQGAEVGLPLLAALGAPFLVVLISLWRHNKAPLVERILIVVIEGFETVMKYVSNTLSFLRVAAFSLNHVALAIAVYTLAEMMQQTGYWLTLVLGNIFIMVLEGGIVAIQVLRLEYYEGFSRFFSGDGRPFKPVVLERRHIREER